MSRRTGKTRVSLNVVAPASRRAPDEGACAGSATERPAGVDASGAGASPSTGSVRQTRRGFRAVKPPVVAFVSLGCSKNLVDSEAMLGRLAESGCVISADESAADTVVVNTCGFLESSRTEALDICRDLAERKRRGRLRRLVVAGCLVQRDGEGLREEVPEIDALVGVNNRDDVVRAVWRMDRDAAVSLYLGDYHAANASAAAAAGLGGRWSDQTRLRLTPRHYAYLRISEGCDQKCTFCTIPSIRGPMHSKTPEQIIEEGHELIADGARELLLIGQDTTSYGRDIRDDAGLAGLLPRLNAEWPDARWIRLMYVYPSVFTDEMIDAIAESERVVKYIDIPLQHINDRVLKAMHRRTTRKQTEELLHKLRARIPDVTIRSTFIVGFPGETEAEFKELLGFIRDFRFDAAGAFKYSLEPETPAGRMKQQLEDAIKQERRERFMLAQQEVAFAAARRWIGREFEVLVDQAAPRRAQPAGTRGGRSAKARGGDEGGSVAFAANGGSLGRENTGSFGPDGFDNPAPIRGRAAIGRHSGQAPDVDAVCLIEKAKVAPGELVRVRCTGTAGYDLVCKPI